MVEKLIHLIGVSAPRVYATLLELNPDISALAVAQYRQPPLVQDRANLSDMEQSLATAAARERATSYFSYLETVLVLSSAATHQVEGILDAVMYHQPHPVDRIWLSRDSVLEGRLLEMCAQTPPDEHLAIFAKVRSRNRQHRRIPLLDLRIEKTSQSLQMVISIAKRLLPNGYAVLETSRSYHLVGLRPMNDVEAMSLLAKALLFSPITDHAYIAHQMIEREACLRISGRGLGESDLSVVAVGDNEFLEIESKLPEMSNRIPAIGRKVER